MNEKQPCLDSLVKCKIFEDKDETLKAFRDGDNKQASYKGTRIRL